MPNNSLINIAQVLQRGWREIVTQLQDMVIDNGVKKQLNVKSCFSC